MSDVSDFMGMGSEFWGKLQNVGGICLRISHHKIFVILSSTWGKFSVLNKPSYHS